MSSSFEKMDSESSEEHKYKEMEILRKIRYDAAQRANKIGIEMGLKGQDLYMFVFEAGVSAMEDYKSRGKEKIRTFIPVEIGSNVPMYSEMAIPNMFARLKENKK
jgi:hypothetical protein